jgi:hypothetical protein
MTEATLFSVTSADFQWNRRRYISEVWLFVINVVRTSDPRLRIIWLENRNRPDLSHNRAAFRSFRISFKACCLSVSECTCLCRLCRFVWSFKLPFSMTRCSTWIAVSMTTRIDSIAIDPFAFGYWVRIIKVNSQQEMYTIKPLWLRFRVTKYSQRIYCRRLIVFISSFTNSNCSPVRSVKLNTTA